jgi:hypothetical protein
MTLTKVAQKKTPNYTFLAYRDQKGKLYWRNPFNNELLPLKKNDLKSWTLV